MKIKTGCVGFHITFRVPNDDVAQMETFFEKHEDFMRETHHIEGTVETSRSLLCSDEKS